MKAVKPPRLRKGDLIGIVAPASTPSAQEKVDKGVRYLEQLGYHVKIGKHVMAEYGYFAGTDEQRAEDLKQHVARSGGESSLRDPRRLWDASLASHGRL